jgi:WD40 repeat protein
MKEIKNLNATCISTFRGFRYHSGAINAAVMLKDNNLIISGDENGVLCIAALSQTDVIHQCQAFTEGIESISICPTFPIFAVGSLVGKITIFNLSDYSSRLTITTAFCVIKLLWNNL